MTPLEFDVNITIDESTGAVIAVYFQTRRGKVHETREFADGAAFADYNRDGELLGIELLGPCRATIVDQLAQNESVTLRKSMKAFVRRVGPREIVAA